MQRGQPESQADGQVIVPVQFLRGAAASFVVTVHLLGRLLKRGAFPQGLPEWTDAFGAMGVATFFAISGFIMVYTTADQFGSAAQGRRFLWRRILRVVPIYYLTSALMMIFTYVTFGFSTNKVYVAPSVGEVVLSALFIPYLDSHGIAHPVYGLGWTLEYEMFFYLVFAGAMLLPLRQGVAAAMALLLALIALGLLVAEPAGPVGQVVVLPYFTRPVLLYFVIGMALGLARRQGMLRAVALPHWGIGLIALGFMAAGVRFGGVDVGPVNAGMVALALAVAVLLEGRRGGSPRFDRWARAFGDASYSIYLTHSFLLGLVAVAMAPLAGKGVGLLILVVLAACLLCFAVAWLVWRKVEVPLTRVLRPKRGSDLLAGPWAAGSR